MLIASLIMVACLMGRSDQQANKSEIVSVSIRETYTSRGEQSTVVIHVRIKEGYHIQANKVEDASLIPVALKIIQGGPFHISKIIFPPYKLFRLDGTAQDLRVFDNVFIIRLLVKTPPATKPGRYLIQAQLHYQACDARNCLFPRTVTLELPVIVLSGTEYRQKQ